MAENDALIRALQARNKAGDLDAIPVAPPDDSSTWMQRLGAFLKQGGPMGQAQPGQRGTWVPSQINEQGKPELAVPGVIQQPAESLQSLMTAPLSDIVRSGDRDAMKAAAEASFDVAGALPAAGAAIGRTVPNNAAGIFGGRLAKTADHAALKRAEDMAAKGAPREDIWRDTGWFKGVDGKWRFEIDDSKAAMKYPAGEIAREVAQVMGVAGDMKDVFSHPNAYAAYPDAATIPGDIGLFRRGTYYREPGIGGEMISVSAKDADRVPHTLHEFQHAIQNREKFGRGGNPAALREQLQGSIPDSWLRNDVLSEAYKRLAGEVESRAVETRANLTQDERRARPPWLDYDVPENQQIVKFSSNPDDPTSAAVTAALAAQDKPKGIKAYHGSPHDFDRFDLSKINTGEGSQAFGHGLYFAENEAVAKSYRDGLGGSSFGRTLDLNDPADYAADVLTKVGLGTPQSVERAIARLEEIKANGMRMQPRTEEQRAQLANWVAQQDAAIERLRAGTYTPYTPNGRLYEVNINASPEDFLDWDKPLSQQPEKIKTVAESFKEKFPADRTWDLEKLHAPDLLNIGGDQAVSSALREAGIPGIRYLDQGSRTAGEGSRNYVVFDDALVDILRKYSNPDDPTTAAILALLTAQQGGQQQQ